MKRLPAQFFTSVSRNRPDRHSDGTLTTSGFSPEIVCNIRTSFPLYPLTTKVDAIKPVTRISATPGHAMKVSDHTKSQGAILGKAMSALKEGTGLELVLVTLQ